MIRYLYHHDKGDSRVNYGRAVTKRAQVLERALFRAWMALDAEVGEKAPPTVMLRAVGERLETELMTGGTLGDERDLTHKQAICLVSELFAALCRQGQASRAYALDTAVRAELAAGHKS